MGATVSCIICAYNEAARIGNVLAAVSGYPDVAEVIVVDDGSTDGTAEVVSRYPGVTLIRHERNLGKAQAIVTGTKAAQNDIVMLVDADIAGLTQDNVHRLIMPVQNGAADMTMSLRKNSLLIYRLMGCDFVSGERVMPKRLIADHYEEIQKLPPYGFEVFNNRIAIDEGLRVKVVVWSNVIHPPKPSKIGFIPGWRSDIKMFRDVFKVVTPLELLQQNYFLSGLR